MSKLLSASLMTLLLSIVASGCLSAGHYERAQPDADSVRFTDTDAEELPSGGVIYTGEGEMNGRPFTRYDIEYSWKGKEFSNYFDPNLRPALDWICANTPDDAVFLSWWDYGHMIRGYAGRDVVIYSPSEDILWTLASGQWDAESSGEFSDRASIDDVVSAFVTKDALVTMDVMDDHAADYIFVTKSDEGKSFVLFSLSGDDSYLDESGKPQGEAYETILLRMVGAEEIEGFVLLYQDGLVRIYGKA